jgi:hypothetical protein
VDTATNNVLLPWLKKGLSVQLDLNVLMLIVSPSGDGYLGRVYGVSGRSWPASWHPTLEIAQGAVEDQAAQLLMGACKQLLADSAPPEAVLA